MFMYIMNFYHTQPLQHIQWELLKKKTYSVSCFKGAWHENLEKLILLKLQDRVNFHLNISSTMKKTKFVSGLEVIGENCAYVILLFYLVWWPRFLISKQHFRWFLLNYLEYAHQISPQKSEKYDKTFGIKIRVGLKKIGGMMLWIMSGTFK